MIFPLKAMCSWGDCFWRLISVSLNFLIAYTKNDLTNITKIYVDLIAVQAKFILFELWSMWPQELVPIIV